MRRVTTSGADRSGHQRPGPANVRPGQQLPLLLLIPFIPGLFAHRTPAICGGDAARRDDTQARVRRLACKSAGTSASARHSDDRFGSALLAQRQGPPGPRRDGKAAARRLDRREQREQREQKPFTRCLFWRRNALCAGSGKSKVECEAPEPASRTRRLLHLRSRARSFIFLVHGNGADKTPRPKDGENPGRIPLPPQSSQHDRRLGQSGAWRVFGPRVAVLGDAPRPLPGARPCAERVGFAARA